MKEPFHQRETFRFSLDNLEHGCAESGCHCKAVSHYRGPQKEMGYYCSLHTPIIGSSVTVKV